MYDIVKMACALILYTMVLKCPVLLGSSAAVSWTAQWICCTGPLCKARTEADFLIIGYDIFLNLPF